MRAINKYLLKLSKRAETYDKRHLIESFVDIGPLFTLLSNRDNQILFGRRGTGKTHIFAFLADQMNNSGHIALHLDMRTIGSTGGIYSDSSLPLQERATRLLVDTLCAIHDGILTEIIERDNEFDLSTLGPCLDNFADVAAEVIVDGPILLEEKKEASSSTTQGLDSGFQLSPQKVTAQAKMHENSLITEREQTNTKREGRERYRVHFGAVGNELNRLIRELSGKELWIILDEWSEIPLDLQPYLADLLRRTLFPIRGISVKIAAIQQRCCFRIPDDDVGHIGIEVGSDIAPSISLDEFLVFDNDAEQANAFFTKLLYKHIKAISKEDNELASITSENQIIKDIFTQNKAFDEFVIASEGIPRDAINIIGLAAQEALNDKISIPTIRSAARSWYIRSKQQAITSKEKAPELLNWIVDEVIQHRQAKAFLLSVYTKDALIDFLYDARVLHLIKEGLSAQDLPGQRFNAFALDYGCYVDLINTSRAPKGLFEVETETGAEYVEVPRTDFRAIRRAILDIAKFYEKNL